MNSEERKEQELADRVVELMESVNGDRLGCDDALTHELGQQLRDLPDDDQQQELDQDLRANLVTQFDDAEKVLTPEGANALSNRKPSRWKRFWAVAASLMLLGGLAVTLFPSFQPIDEVAQLPSALYTNDDVQYKHKSGTESFTFNGATTTGRSTDQVLDDLLEKTENDESEGKEKLASAPADVPDAAAWKSESERVTRANQLADEKVARAYQLADLHKSLQPSEPINVDGQASEPINVGGQAVVSNSDGTSTGLFFDVNGKGFGGGGGGFGLGGGGRGGSATNGPATDTDIDGAAEQQWGVTGLPNSSLGTTTPARIAHARQDLAYTKELLTKANNKLVELDPRMQVDGTRPVGKWDESDEHVKLLKKVRNQFQDRYRQQQEEVSQLLGRIEAPVLINGQSIHHVKISKLGKKIESAKMEVATDHSERQRITSSLEQGEAACKEMLWTLLNEGKIKNSGSSTSDDRTVKSLQTRLQDLEIARIDVTERYGPKHPRRKSIDRQIDHVQQRLDDAQQFLDQGEDEKSKFDDEPEPKEALQGYLAQLEKRIADNQELIRESMEQYVTHEAEAEKINAKERKIEEALRRLSFLKDEMQKANAEQYLPIVENPFVTATGAKALSTFSIDVDTASYANMRRFIKHGQLPPPNAIRLEELINYFDYQYDQPDGDVPFSTSLELAGCPWNDNHRLLRIGLQGKDVHVAERPATNVVFLIDVSGSMQNQNKLPLLKRGFQMMVEQLREDDRVSIVTYAGNAGVALEPTSGDQKKVINDAIEKLTSGGSTHGSAGIEMAYRLAQQNFIAKGSNKVILATDGDLNVGVTSDDQLVKLIKQKAAEGVFLTVLGFGTGNLKDGKLEKIADNGNGVYAYIDSLREANKVLVQQLSAALLTIAKDVKLQIEFNPAEVKSYRLLGYENRALKTEDFDNDRKDAGEIGAGHSVTALYEIVPAKMAKNRRSATPVGLKYQEAETPTTPDSPENRLANLSEAAESGELATVAVRYKLPDAQTSQKLEFAIKNQEKSFVTASDDFRFAASVAAFGMLLRGSAYSGDATFDQIEDIGAGAMGADASGYRAEFIDLVRKAAAMSDRR